MHWQSTSRRVGRRHRHEQEYHARKRVFGESSRFVEGWNARRADHLAAAAAAGGNSTTRAPHSVALNHFADWSREEYLTLVKPDR